MRDITIRDIEEYRRLAQEAVMDIINQYEQIAGMEVTELNFVLEDDGTYSVMFYDNLKRDIYLRFDQNE